jgi:branched-chain amino acid transport system substrate-binding protein
VFAWRFCFWRNSPILGGKWRRAVLFANDRHESFRMPFNKNVFNIHDGYMVEMEKIVEYLDAMGVKKVAVLYRNDAYGKSGLEGVTLALKKRNLDVLATAVVERNSVDVAAVVAKMKAALPRAIVMISAYKASVVFIRAMRKNNDHLRFFRHASLWVAGGWPMSWGRKPAAS